MKRRIFIAGLGSAAAWPMAARAQRSLPVVGWLDQRSQMAPTDIIDGFRRGLTEMGFFAGRNVTIEYRYGEGRPDRLPVLAADLVGQKVALIVVPSGGETALAVKAATRTIPIVFVMGNDPVELGLVASLNRPGDNLTGVAILGADIAGKRLELLHKLVPAAELIDMLSGRADNVYNQAETREMQSAARALGVRLLALHAVTSEEIAAAFATLVEQRVGALLIGGSVILDAARELIISLAARHAIPTMFFYSTSVTAGGLLSYGPDFVDANRHAGIYTGRILKGEKPGELPVVRSAKFELVINLQIAKQLGLSIPPTLLALADRVIE
jgi:putative ABC transport system substrate-binding protein